MYAIISKGELLALCERPRYVKRNEETGAYVEAAEAEAIGIAVGGEVYNLPGGTAIPDAPEALAQEGEAEEYVFRNHARIIENEEATNAAFVAMEEAMCDMDSSSEERLTAVEEALCELDSAANGGGCFPQGWRQGGAGEPRGERQDQRRAVRGDHRRGLCR